MNWQEHIDDILDNFDFNHVEHAMKLLDWQWHNKGVPDQATLRKEARRILIAASKLPMSWTTGTGGLSATNYGNCLELSFVLTTWDSSYLIEDNIKEI